MFQRVSLLSKRTGSAETQSLRRILTNNISGTGFSAAAFAPSSFRSFSSFWNHVPMGPKDPILGVTEAFKADPDPSKISVGVGAYRDDQGKPFVLQCVRKAEKLIAGQQLDHEYAPIGGLPHFVKAATALAYGADSPVITENKVAALQSLSGTGALRLVGEYLKTHSPFEGTPTVLLPNPTWGNHVPIFKNAGCNVGTYRYYCKDTFGIDMEGLLEDLTNFDGRAAVLLHACAHNPTGVDPSMEQWKQISDVCKEKGHLVIFDNAYQGFASGDTDKDIRAARYFIEQGHNIALCQSFAKNFGLYGERTGCFSIVCENNEEMKRVESQLNIIARAAYSNPPINGALIVSTILNNPELTELWKDEIRLMSGRIIEMRKLLKENLIAAGSKRNWDHITNQIGMFSFTGATPEQCDYMTKNHHIYLTRNGRISMAGVNSSNVGQLATALHEATK